MVYPCLVQNCKNIGTHHFPKDEQRKAQWIKAIKHIKPGLSIRKHNFICSTHFLKKDYTIPTCFTKLDLAQKHLKKTAIPSVFPWTPVSEEQNPPSTEIVFDPSKAHATYSRTPSIAFVEIPPLLQTHAVITEDPLQHSNKEEVCVYRSKEADAVPTQNAGAGEGQVEAPAATLAVCPVKEEIPVIVDSEITKPPKSETPVPIEVKVERCETPKENGDWNQRELDLLKKIEDLEKVKTEVDEDKLRVELKLKEQEVELLKARVISLETELQLALSKPGGAKNQEVIENIKLQHEELLSKARGMIFDKTKMVKNQELQIEALNMQVQSLKDINIITKDLLEIRNSEVKAMEDRLEAMEARFKAEKQRYGLVLQKAETSGNLNCDLKKEYQTQLGLFKELRVKYEERVQALVAENNRLKESLKVDPPPPAT